ncbi:hypothetical protein EJ05DRAFT_479144 [Pseudovirgaria hyperparasitica]|uniref:Uncharacterized protein n=1 Tax=Pseudovirgaria hyperparasitica TaxID=470096 RepID=A0A6A6VVV5_9PEZI|nr:uncharacterized protein EJ05DRAFT_479144 [Pseudovirgaria hyperparasitica]KAF2754712.1 hypothetical protein EJ05DRAFT_479144 [Pseudovirgaria hyperparasitica]
MKYASGTLLMPFHSNSAGTSQILGPLSTKPNRSYSSLPFVLASVQPYAPSSSALSMPHCISILPTPFR